MIDSKVSRRYAKALLSLGQEDGHYAEYGQNLKEFGEFCAANEEFIQVVSNQLFSVEERKKILDFVLGKSTYPDLLKNFLRLLLDKNRIGAVQQISNYYSKLTDDISNITRAEVTTARTLAGDAQERLMKALADFTSKDVKMMVREDKSLIGGLVVKLGDMVLDGSVRAQIEGLKESLKRGEYN
ncbi:MAG: ATP synthase F1 subunit delta [Deltaproteobacteria bacterium]|nr:ATP synthase F1 subunit delta [Deltaproteobacteria bacterium]